MAAPERSTMEKLLTSERALQYTRDAAREFAESRLKTALSSAEPASPMLVQRIDRKDAYTLS